MRQSEVTTNACVYKIWRKTSKWYTNINDTQNKFKIVGQDSIILIRFFLIRCLTNDKGKYTRILTGEG